GDLETKILSVPGQDPQKIDQSAVDRNRVEAGIVGNAVRIDAAEPGARIFEQNTAAQTSVMPLDFGSVVPVSGHESTLDLEEVRRPVHWRIVTGRRCEVYP